MNHPLGFSIIEGFNSKLKNGQNNGTSSIQRKKTQKNRKSLNKKVENFLQSIDSNDSNDSDSEPFSNFTTNENTHKENLSNNPYARPTSMYNENMNMQESMNTQEGMNRQEGMNMQQGMNTQESTTDESVNVEEFNTIQKQMPHQSYYDSYVPYSTNVSNNQTITGEKDMLIEKLNYMIHLLEEQHEEKTGHITEELILYTFLGVFVIFVIDSFARAGKYVR